MSISLKTKALKCMLLKPPFSVVRDIFGYTASTRKMSLRRQLELMGEPGVGLNIIRVGVENFTTLDMAKIDYGLQVAREIYGEVDFSIHKILRDVDISVSDAGAYVTIDSEAEAVNLTDDFSGPDNGFIDVFVVPAWTCCGTTCDVGLSEVCGPFVKKSKICMTGCVVTKQYSSDVCGVGFAHEIAHYLCQDHSEDPSNFLYKDTDGTNRGITADQGDHMKKYLPCIVFKPC
jgi:hypothetical protein